MCSISHNILNNLKPGVIVYVIKYFAYIFYSDIDLFIVTFSTDEI